jgi:pantothenate kinase type III
MPLRGAVRSGVAQTSAMDLVLTADLGNSRLKLCAWNVAHRTVVARHTAVADDGLGRAVADFARDHGPFRTAALSSVAAREREDEVSRALHGAQSGSFVLAPDCGLAIDVREPARAGRDRLYAARGALELVRGIDDAVLVVDAGTALTVDALDARGDGRFLGGAIAPGPTLLARVLAEHTARLPLVELDHEATALGRDTESAVRSGVVVGFRGAALELALRIADEAGFRAPAVVTTGGASRWLHGIFDRVPFARVVDDPDAVHRGLFASVVAATHR